MCRASLILLSILIFNSSAFAKQPDGALTIDYPIPTVGEFNFPNEDKIYPTQSDFVIQNVITMSNDAGERWATVTLRNKASGQRILKSNQLLALFANGERVYPVFQEQSFSAKETITMTVYFGENDFPILSLYTRHF